MLDELLKLKLFFNKMVHFVLIRHSERLDTHPCDGIAWDDKDTRRYDPPISNLNLPAEATKEMEKALCSYLKVEKINVSRIISSPFRRCIQTAQLIGHYFGVQKYTIDSRVGEVPLEVRRCLLKQEKQTETPTVSLLSNSTIIEILSNQKQRAIVPSDNETKDENKSENDVQVDLQLAPNVYKDLTSNEQFQKDLIGFVQDLKKNYVGVKSDTNQVIIIVTHGQNITWLIEYLTDSSVLLSCDECGWVLFSHTDVLYLQSEKRCHVLSTFT
ncbi:hypothetical protein RFI_24087 [Reticulomyxa filosa]|uniref:Phosphoglycerate mutase family protein n=1 Tax=Reticulomyxa filosa TaxID=46433 RepID=X6MGZ1_RETFI|nr:hypothetical protein RFI_24087 [Reticulomyxa filosa]|eukprot:ETO13288.1 hypothetical protein RFI_24087 [Reticulomyxa filosa]